MNTVDLKFGGKVLKLTKSSTMIGLKPNLGRTFDAERATVRAGAEPVFHNLGGFRIVELRNAAQPMEATLNILRSEPGVAKGTHVYHTSDDGVPFVPTGELYIVFSKTARQQELQKILDRYALELVKAHGDRELTVRVTSTSPNPIKVAAELQQSAIVETAEPDLATPGRLSAYVLPGDSLRDSQWHLRNSGKIEGSSVGLKAGADARVLDAWEAAKSLGSPNVIVAVIDDGFDLGHPDVTGTGKVVSPWDFTRNSSDPRPEFNTAYPEWDPRSGEWTGDWHGTACAGVAIGNANGTGILGAAPGSRFMPVRWGAELSDRQVVGWFDYVRAQGAAVVSCSWGPAAAVFHLSSQMSRAINRCASEGRNGKGCVICFAAGNENRDIDDPNDNSVNGFAIHPDVIAVAACTSRDERSTYSNYGDAISVCAPSNGAGGRGILTADVMGTFMRNGEAVESGYSQGAFTDSFGGTSSATPLVAGICALILSVNLDLSAKEVKEIIQSSARKIGPKSSYGPNGHSREFGFGCINAVAAVNQVIGQATTQQTKAERRVKAKRRRKSLAA